MIRNSFKFLEYFLLVTALLFLNSCGKDYTPEELVYIKSIQDSRSEKDSSFENDPNSPFIFKGKVEFHPLNYFDIDPDFVLESRLYEYEIKDSIAIFGTKGEERSSIKFGYLKLNYQGSGFDLNVYETIYQDTLKYYSIWFTDRTTNDDTYGVGRYINFKLNENPDHIYMIDFNSAYNPYCAYTSTYSCAIPTKEDHIDIAIKAGEKKFHD